MAVIFFIPVISASILFIPVIPAVFFILVIPAVIVLIPIIPAVILVIPIIPVTRSASPRIFFHLFSILWHSRGGCRTGGYRRTMAGCRAGRGLAHRDLLPRGPVVDVRILPIPCIVPYLYLHFHPAFKLLPQSIADVGFPLLFPPCAAPICFDHHGSAISQVPHVHGASNQKPCDFLCMFSFVGHLINQSVPILIQPFQPHYPVHVTHVHPDIRIDGQVHGSVGEEAGPISPSSQNGKAETGRSHHGYNPHWKQSRPVLLFNDIIHLLPHLIPHICHLYDTACLIQHHCVCGMAFHHQICHMDASFPLDI